jgi:hypothetical protein
MPAIRILLLLVVIAGLTATGCSKSSTSQASSESSSKSSASSSGSSSPSSREAAYVRDVRDFTAEWVLSGGDEGAFKRRVAEIAKKDGITDWEQDESTYRGIGRGLKKAGLSGQRYSDVSATLTGFDPQRTQWIQKGFDAEPKP